MYDIDGFSQYEMDEDGVPQSKSKIWRFWTSAKRVKGKRLKLAKDGKYQLRRSGQVFHLSPEEIWELRRDQESSRQGVVA